MAKWDLPAAPPRPLKDGCRVGLLAVEKNLVNVPWWQVANVLRFQPSSGVQLPGLWAHWPGF